MVRERFAFGPFQLDIARETLFENGVPVPVGRKALALLRTLVEARGDVVKKSALMEAAWPTVVVEESNLSVQIAALRKRLGGSSDGEEWIATFPRVGYRFAGPLRVEQWETPAKCLHRSPLLEARPFPGRGQIDDEALQLFIRGRSLLMQSPSGNKLAQNYFIKAIGLEPAFSPAHACLAISYHGNAVYYGEDMDANRALGLACARTAVSLDPGDPLAHWALGIIRLYEGELNEAQSEWEAALRIEPNNPDVLAKMADLNVQQGRPDYAIASVEKALRINAHPPGCYYWDLGFAFYAAGRYAEAADVLRKEELGRLPAKRILAASLAQLGRLDEARNEARRFLETNPGFQASHWAAKQPFKYKADREHFIDGYAKAGLPR